MPDARTRASLSSRVVRLSLIVGGLTFVIAIIVGTLSTSRMSSEALRDRDMRALGVIEDAVEDHVAQYKRELDDAVASTDSGAELGNVLEGLRTGEHFGYLQIAVFDTKGNLVAESPQFGASTSLLSTVPEAGRAARGLTGVTTGKGPDGEDWEVRITRVALDKKGRPLLVYARLTLEFLRHSVDEAYGDLKGAKVLVLDGDHVIASRPRDADIALARARWSKQGSHWGYVGVESDDGTLRGHYADIGGIERLRWRTVVLVPASARMADTVNVLIPPFLVMIAGGGIALLAAWVVSLSLTKPLKHLERAALTAASGSYVRRLTSDRDDEIGRAAEAFNAMALRLNSLHDLARLLASTSSLDQVLEGILEAIGHLVGRGSAAIYLLESDGAELVPVRSTGRHLSALQSVRVGQGGWLWESAQSSEARFYKGPAEELADALPGIRAQNLEILALPLAAGREPLGVLVVARDSALPLSEAERDMLTTFSAQAAVAVQKARLFEFETSARRNAEALRAVAQELVRPNSLQSALNTVESIIARLFLAKDAIIALADRDALGLPSVEVPEVESDLLRLTSRAVHRAGDGAFLLERSEDPEVRDLLQETGAHRLLVVPISFETDHGAVLGVALEDSVVAEEAIEFGQALGDEIALALDNAYFYRRAVARAANLETIFSISQVVGSSLQIDVVLNRVLDVVQKILSADSVALMSYDKRKRALTTSMGRGVLPKKILELEVRPGNDIPGQVFTRGEPVVIRNLESAGSDGVAGIAHKDGMGSMLAVPLLARGHAIGVLMVMAASTGAFNDEDLNTLQTFASQAALAIDTARLYGREHEVATVLQQSILPDELPEFPEIDAGSVYAPADVDIGGDYYDLFRGRDGAIWFAIGDVCGKGVHAATKTSMIKFVVRALVIAGQSPSEVLSEVNTMISETGDASDIVTLWLGRLDTETGKLTWADGGHPPGVLRRVDGVFESLGVSGPLLGAAPGAQYAEFHTCVSENDRILLYTDGVTESRRGNIFFGEERVREVLDRHESASQAARGLLSAVKEYVHGDLRDDVAVLAVIPKYPRKD